METTKSASVATQLRAGVAKVEITDAEAKPVNDPVYARALALGDGTNTAVLVSVEAVAIAEIGTIQNDFLANVRAQLQEELSLRPQNLLINASHCHAVVCPDIEERTVRAVKEAWANMVPVTVGVGTGREDRIMENRRLRLKDGGEADVRMIHGLPPDEEILEVGPVDPEIGILRLDAEDGRTLAVVYNFACHPIKGVPSFGYSGDVTGFSSRLIEDNLSAGAIALFVQGCSADVNPAFYKSTDVSCLPDAEQLGNMLGLNTLKAAREISTGEGGALKVIHETLQLPRADFSRRIEAMEAEQQELLESLTTSRVRRFEVHTSTSLNLKTFLSLYVKYHLFPDYPSYYSYRYLHEKMTGREELAALDAENKAAMNRYIQNIHIMEQMTRHQINIKLLKKNQAWNEAAEMKPIEAEVVGMRVGDFVLVTFPGELPVQMGLDIKKRSPHKFFFVAGVTNGYIFYTPTVEQLANAHGAQEDCDCLVAPEWQPLFEAKVAEILERL